MVLTKKRQAFSDRRSRRMAQHGRAFEVQVNQYLQELKDQGVITDFIKHPAQSEEDYDGKDFTVVRSWAGGLKERSFGVTISLTSWHKGRLLHPHTTQFCFPIGTKKETIVRRILELFA